MLEYGNVALNHSEKSKVLFSYPDKAVFYVVDHSRLFSWGRFYDHNFLRFSTIFGEKIAFFSKTNVVIKILHNLALF
jgi:hypothetical protein